MIRKLSFSDSGKVVEAMVDMKTKMRFPRRPRMDWRE